MVYIKQLNGLKKIMNNVENKFLYKKFEFIYIKKVLKENSSNYK